MSSQEREREGRERVKRRGRREGREGMEGRGNGLHPSLHCAAAREWVEPHLHAANLVYPVFVTDRVEDVEVKGFEPNKQWGVGNGALPYTSLVEELERLQAKGLRSVMLFGVVKEKDDTGTQADKDHNPVVIAVGQIRNRLAEMMVLVDVCLCEYTDHGHCGILKDVSGHGQAICNDSSVKRLAQVALRYAQAGAHWVCPSDMMDGRVHEIRKVLDQDFHHVGIMAYTSKKASGCMYAPFRDAVESTFKGNRQAYQQPMGSILHARQALRRDEAEGASVVLVKPALFYADIIKEYAQTSNLPIACYIVSGEYVMLKDYGKRIGDLASVLRESHVSMLRAGASILITYFTPELLDLIPQWR